MKYLYKFRMFLILLSLPLCSGCITNWMYVIEDHTLGIVSRPVSSTGELLWRVKTFSGETLSRFKVKVLNFPQLEKITVPPIDPDRKEMAPNFMSDWLENRYGKTVKGDLKLLIGGDKFFSRLYEAIVSAKKSINISTYIFDNDKVGLKLANILKEKSKNVKIRIVYDYFASKLAWKKDAANDSEDLPQVKKIIKYLRKDSKIKIKRSENVWLSSDHVKNIIIDDQIVFFGGMNIGNEYRYKWRDMMIECTGNIVNNFNQRFHNTWSNLKIFSEFKSLLYKKTFRYKKNENPGSIKCNLLLTTPLRHQIYHSQLRAARNAKHHIYVENSYLWNYHFIYALCEARKRGVDVRVTLSLKTDFPMLKGASRIVINTLLKHGVRVFIYPGMTHVKAAVFDNWACFGTANFDDLSLHKNNEINLSTSDEGFVAKLENELLIDGQNKSNEVTEIMTLEFLDNLYWNLTAFV